jgi:hypothetical protein
MPEMNESELAITFIPAIPLKREPEAPSIRRTRFFYSVGYGLADLYTFNTLDEAARFAKGKIEALTAIERSIDTNPERRFTNLKDHAYRRSGLRATQEASIIPSLTQA